MKITSLKNGGFKAEPTIPSTLVESKSILSLLIDSRLNGKMNEKDIINLAANDAIMNDSVVLIDVSQLKSHMDAQAIIRSDNSKAQLKVFKEYKVSYLKDIEKDIMPEAELNMMSKIDEMNKKELLSSLLQHELAIIAIRKAYYLSEASNTLYRSDRLLLRLINKLIPILEEQSEVNSEIVMDTTAFKRGSDNVDESLPVAEVLQSNPDTIINSDSVIVESDPVPRRILKAKLPTREPGILESTYCNQS